VTLTLATVPRALQLVGLVAASVALLLMLALPLSIVKAAQTMLLFSAVPSVLGALALRFAR